MESIKHITDHILNTYKFEVVPPGVPVKYNKERLDKSIWFMRGDVEISIMPIPIEASIYVKFLTGNKINPNTKVFIMMLYYNPIELYIGHNRRIINSQSNIEDLDDFLCTKVPELLQIKRDTTLSKLLD